MKRLFSLLCICLALFPTGASATPTKEPVRERGLLISPLRQYLKADAGSAIQSAFSVANLTDKPLEVTFSVQQFSVTDYVYNYQFESPKNDWLHFSQTGLTLQPGKTQMVPYTVNVPARSAPGGNYYTIFASANLSSQGVRNTIQAADLVYLTVNGATTTTTSLRHSHMPLFAFGRTIPFSIDVLDSGNTHTFVYVSGELRGLLVKPAQTSQARILLPGAVRTLGGSIKSPVLPGVYLAHYGYKADAGWIVEQRRLVVYLPPWFLAFALAAALLLGRLWVRHKQSSKRSSQSID